MKTWCALIILIVAVTDLASAERHHNHHHHHNSLRQKEDGPLNCGTPGCPSVCRIQYGPQADGFCQTSEEQYCVCIHTTDRGNGIVALYSPALTQRKSEDDYRLIEQARREWYQSGGFAWCARGEDKSCPNWVEMANTRSFWQPQSK